MNPTVKLSLINASKLLSTVSIYSSLRLPKPSSINNESILIPPWLLLIVSLKPKARAREALNFSPPDKEETSLSLPV